MITTIDIIKELVSKWTVIKEITVIEFPDGGILQDRFPEKDLVSKAIDQALEIRSNYYIPFWDALLATQFSADKYTPIILKEALFHNHIRAKMTLTRERISDIDNLMVAKSRNYGINSLLITKEQYKLHFILLDFHIPIRSDNVACIEEVIRLLGLTGYLLVTNKSYHFIGDSLVEEAELQKILYKALLFSPIIDKNWVAHQLIENSCTLRITPKEGGIPYLITKID